MRSRDPTTETGQPKLRNSEGEAENTRNREGEILTADCRMNADRGLEENVRLCSPMFAVVRLCSPMFAYVRLMREKCSRRRMVNVVRSCKLHDKRRWRVVELAPPSTRGNVWRGGASISVARDGCVGMPNR